MSFRDFSLQRVQHDFDIRASTTQPLFVGVLAVPISEELTRYWSKVMPLGLTLNTEKARSELITALLLAEVWVRSNRQIAMLSGVEWAADEAAGLNGVSDFLLCRSPLAFYVTAPVLVAVEAKKESISDGLGQCAATMVGAQRFNRKAGRPIDPIYGCVTTGAVWRFLRLDDRQLDIDCDEYYIDHPDRILGILLHCCGVTV